MRPVGGQLHVDPLCPERANSVEYTGVILDTVQSALTREECEANLAEAVRRWNAHEALADVARDLEVLCDGLARGYNPKLAELAPLKERAHVALAKARGGK